MGRILGGVEIDRNPADPSAEPSVMPLEHAGRQLASHCIELLAPHVVFEAGDRRLRGERLAGHGVPPEQQLVNGVVAQPVGIVPIGMATRDAEDPLAEQVRQRSRTLPACRSSTRHWVNPSITPYCRSAALRTAPPSSRAAIEGGNACRGDPERGQSVVPCRSSRTRLRCGQRSVSAAFVPHGGVRFSNIGRFTE